MMFTIPRSTLRTVLTHVAPAVPRRSARPVLTGVHVSCTAETVTFTGTDLAMSASYTVPTECTPGACVLPLADVKAASKGRGDVTFQAVGDDVLVHADYVATVRPLRLDEWPRTPDSTADPVEVAVAPFASVMSAISKDAARPILCSVYLHRDRVVATDSYRLCVADRPVSEPPIHALVPGRAVVQAVKAAARHKADSMLVAVHDRPAGTDETGGGRVSFTSGPACVTVREISGDYPNYRGLIPDPTRVSASITFTDPSTCAKILRDTFRGYGKTNTPVRVSTLDGVNVAAKMTVQGKGEREIVLPGASWSGYELNVAYNPDFLADLLDGMDSGMVFGMIDAQRPAIATDLSGRTRLLMPVRVS